MHIQFGSLCWDLKVVFSLPRHPECDQWQANIQNRLCVFFCLKALFSTINGGFLQPLPPSSLMSSALLWFSCHYLLIKVENNSPGPGHLFNDKPHSSVCLPAGSWFSCSGHHASAHRTSSFHLTRHWSMRDQRANHFICCLSTCECIWGGFFSLPLSM